MSAANPPTGSPTTQTNPAVDHVDTIAVDDNDDDAVSEFRAHSVASSSTSVASSVLEYRQENGRTYHSYKAGKYLMPNDDREVERLDLQHNLFMHMFRGRLATAPPAQSGVKVGRVLDVGTGSGIWAMDFADEHPEAEVLGMDLSAVQPEFTPPNLKFEIDDVEEPWTYSRPFDYIHSRMMNSSIGDWKEYFQKAYDNLTPGGYFEIVEPDIIPLSDDGTLTEKHSIVKTGKLLIEEVGFVDVTMQHFKWPTNSWPKDPHFKELGIWQNENLSQGWEAICLASLTRALGWTKEEALLLLAENRKDFNDRSIHAYYSIWTIYGKKPEKDAKEENTQS